MRILPFQPEHITAAADLFARNFQQQRQAVPILPETYTDPSVGAQRIAAMLEKHAGIAAVDGDQLAGYLLWMLVDDFRSAGRKAAYCPVWAHAASDRKAQIYPALYREAAGQWAAAGCQVHAITLLAADTAAEKTWFWSGFGLAVVDAIRPVSPLGGERPDGVTIRRAQVEDAGTLADLEAEHSIHYTRPPVLMNPSPPSTTAEFVELIEHPVGSAWLACVEGVPAGYLRMEVSSFGAADIAASDTTVSITGAYVQPAWRGRRIAPALLDAALREYAARGFRRCSVDFESFNPEAAAFWMQHFEPVCYSLMRVPERT